MTKIDIQYQDQFGRWRHLQTKHNEGDAYRSAANRARSTRKRHPLVDQNGTLLDVLDLERKTQELICKECIGILFAEIS